jgi:hypothetical protein
MTEKNESAGRRLKNSYESYYTGMAYQPIPENGDQNIPKEFYPPSGGTAARTIKFRPIEPDKDRK